MRGPEVLPETPLFPAEPPPWELAYFPAPSLGLLSCLELSICRVREIVRECPPWSFSAPQPRTGDGAQKVGEFK